MVEPLEYSCTTSLRGVLYLLLCADKILQAETKLTFQIFVHCIQYLDNWIHHWFCVVIVN